MPFQLNVPEPNGRKLTLSIDVGQCLFVLGANGTGKSSLMQRIYSANREVSRRISAHRQNWFASGSLTLSPHEKRNVESAVLKVDANEQSRWKDDYATHRASIALYDLIEAENIRARSITEAVDIGNFNLAEQLARIDAPLKVINSTFAPRKLVLTY